MEDPLVSIIVPVYNSEAFLDKCLMSIQAQSYGNIQIILVDDGSTDGSAEICDEYAEDDNRMIVIHKQNGGVSSARNAGLNAAAGTYILFVDSDDWIDQDTVKTLMDIQRTNDFDMIIFGYYQVHKVDDHVSITKVCNSILTCNSKDDLLPLTANMIQNGSINQLWNKLYKSSILRNNKIYFDEKLNLAEDALFNYHAFFEIDTLHVTDPCFYHYIMREESLAHKYNPMKYEMLKHVNDSLQIKINKTPEYKGMKPYADHIRFKNAYSCVFDLFRKECSLDFKSKRKFLKKVSDSESCFPYHLNTGAYRLLLSILRTKNILLIFITAYLIQKFRRGLRILPFMVKWVGRRSFTRRILQYIENLKRKATQVQNYKKHLLPGEYVFDQSLNYIYRQTDRSHSTLLNNIYTKLTLQRSSLKKHITYWLKNIFFPPFWISEKEEMEESFLGSLFQIGSDGKPHRIFDLDNHKILILYSDPSAYNKRIRHFRRFHEHFPMPDLLTLNDKDLSITEEYIPAIEVSSWSESSYMDVMADFMEKELDYLKKCKISNDYKLKSMKAAMQEAIKEVIQRDSKKRPMADYLLQHISTEVFDEKIPFVKLHGDLWSSNILIHSRCPESIYYIDWEQSQPYIFYYDIFYLILNECFIQSNFLYVTHYMNGDYDEKLEEIFHVFEIPFSAKHRIEYLYLTLLNQYIIRWSSKGKKEERNIMRQWKRIFQKIIPKQ